MERLPHESPLSQECAILPHASKQGHPGRGSVNSEVEQGRVIAMPFAYPHPKFYTQLIYRKKKWVSQALQDFIGLFEEVGKNRI